MALGAVTKKAVEMTLCTIYKVRDKNHEPDRKTGIKPRSQTHS